MLGTPAAGVGRIHPDDRDPAAGGHPGQPSAELSGRDASDGAAQSLSALSAAQGLAPGGARIGEVEVLHHDRRAVVLLGQVEQRADGRAHPSVALRRSQPRGIDRNRDGFADWITAAIKHAAREMIGIEVHTQHRPGTQVVELGHRRGAGLSTMRPHTNARGRGRS